MQTNSIYNCSMVEFPINHRDRGNLTVISNNDAIPFAVKRLYYLYDVPGGESRGGHAHRESYSR